MKYKRPFLLDILPWFHSLLLFAGIYPLFASLLLFKGTAFFRISTAGVLMIIPIILSWVLLQRIPNAFLFMAGGILCTAATAFTACLWGGFGKTSGQVCAVLTAIFSLFVFGIHAHTKAVYGNRKREFLEVHGDSEPFELKEREIPCLLSCPKPYHWVWFTLLYIPGMLLHFTTYLYIMFAILFADIFICIGYHYISALYEYVRQNRRVASLPVAAMHQIHRLIGIIGALLLFLFLLPSLLYGREFEPDFTTDKPLLHIEKTVEEQPPESTPAGGAGIDFREALDIQQKDDPKWILTLARILGYILSVLIVFTVIVTIIRGIRRFGKDFSVEEEDEVVFLKPDHGDRSQRFFTLSGHKKHLSASQQIRRRYRRIILKATKWQPSLWATPSELEQNAALSDSAGMEELHDAYEKARYSEQAFGAHGATKSTLSTNTLNSIF